MSESLKNTAIAAIRTGAAALVTAIITWVTGLGVAVPEHFDESVTIVLFSLGIAAYNALVNFLEKKVHPVFGYLLIIPRSPEYEKEERVEHINGL